MLEESLEQRVQSALDSIRSYIRSDGGDIELVEIKDNKVYVKLTGACVGCPLSLYTLQMGVYEAIVEKSPEITQVIQVDNE